MKRYLVMLCGVALMVAALVAVNAIPHERMTYAQVKDAQEAEKKLEKADKILEDAQKAQKPFKVKFECSNGTFVVEVTPEWAPIGAARFKDLVEQKVLDDAHFFRVIKGFMAQFGIPGDPQVAARWSNAKIKDDPAKKPNKKGTITFATSGKNSRTSQLFINLANNAHLDSGGFTPFGKVVDGMDVVEGIYSGYGARSNQQGPIKSQGNAFLKENFPKLDYIKSATVIK